MFVYNNVYLYLIIYIIFVIFLSLIILLLISLLNIRFWRTQSMFSVYECGFLPFHDSRIKFESKFYMVALSFIIFDLEICFLVPWFLVYTMLDFSSILFFFVFFFLIVMGLVYELQIGVFDWNIIDKNNKK